MRTMISRYATCLLAVSLSAAAVGAGAQEPGPGADTAGPPHTAVEKQGSFDPVAVKTLQALSEGILTARTYEAVVASRVKAQEGQRTLDLRSTLRLVFERPNRFLVQPLDNPEQFLPTLACDGTTLYLTIPQFSAYLAQPAPQTFAPDELGEVAAGFDHLGLPGGIVRGLLSDDPYRSIVEDVTSLRQVGTEKIGATECYRIRGTQEPPLDWDLWVTTEKPPRMVRLVPDFTRLMTRLEEMGGGGAAQQIDARIEFRDSTRDHELPAGMLAYQPPEGYRKLDSLADTNRPAASPMLGKPAPDFQIATLEGKTFQLKERRGQVVVLDFWATWCGPCRTALPIVADVCKRMAEKGVVFCAVNQEEEAGTIRAFLKETGIECRVGLDRDGTVGTAYDVRGIPRTVLIGTDGTVQAVHVGLLPDLETQLRRELTTLTQGEHLVEPAPHGAAPVRNAPASPGSD